MLEERHQNLNAKLIRKSTEVDYLLFSMRNKVIVEEFMNQSNAFYDVFVTVDKEYKRLEQLNEEDVECF